MNKLAKTWAKASLMLALASAYALPLRAETLSVFRGDIDAAISVPIGAQELVVIPTGFCEMSVADPEIADISSPSSTLAQVDGIATGRTSLAIFDCEGSTISIVELLVVPSTGAAAPNGPFYAPKMLSGEKIPVIKNIATITLRLPASVSVIVETDLASSSFEIDDQDIADAATLGNSSFYILGKTAGTTTMYLQHEDGSAPTVLYIKVVGNIDFES